MDYKFISPGKTIGIVGGGQLGRMMALSAREMGYGIAVVDPTESSPCGQIADIEIVGNYDDQEAISRLASVADVITYEFENVDSEMLQWLEENAYVPQGSRLLTITQNRAYEKQSITEAGLRVAPYRTALNKEELEQGIEEIGYPCVVKTCRGGYDGKGQVLIRGYQDIEKSFPLLEQGQCIIEKWMNIDKEVSVIVFRNGKGETDCLPIGENIHKDHILHQTIVPARITAEQADLAKEYAVKIANKLQLIGTLAVEMFITKEGELYINELAPRPHNSGHYSINACLTSQFQQHIRAICNWPLGKSTLIKPAVMVNILGEHVEKVIGKIEHFSDCDLHLYGKKEAKLKRKMGHLTIVADKIEDALQKADALEIWN
ncbi:5-(carboxyamino)imidazole ribonucleotide synthase [Bacillus songklensis]|uniref:N5-carboxyaminoimidazole ribonucleotide synthase n=1 Tax=Bacillus songklensis TaxID=1069116 RepID=A0ABV8B7T8_9BACI